jgi:hypothetical protein
VQGLSDSWSQSRQTLLKRSHINAIVDSFATVLDQAQIRNFERWDILGEYVWPNYFIGDSYTEEIDYMKNWVSLRINWLDNAFPEIYFEDEDLDNRPLLNFNQPKIKTAPNPFTESASFIFYTPFENQIEISIYNVLGEKIRQLIDNVYPEGTHAVRWDGRNLSGIKVANGVYFYRYKINHENVSVNKLIKL